MHTATGSIWNELNWRKRRLEPSIGEVTSDPIIQAVMRRDGALRPFDSASSDRLGDTGPLQLDLWFARLIAERHRGRIVAGAPDGGCGNLFTLSLPTDLH